MIYTSEPAAPQARATGALTLPVRWREMVRARGDSAVMQYDGGSLSYTEADRRARDLAKGLIAAGVGKGSRIGLLLPNSPDFIVCMIAVARIGATVLPISTLSTASELGWLISSADITHLFAARQFRSQDFGALLCSAFHDLDFGTGPPLYLSDAPALRQIWFIGDDPGGMNWPLAGLTALGASIADRLLDRMEDQVDESDHFVIIHTSGSTSWPKGVIHDHGSLLRHLDNINVIRNLVSEDILFGTSPWFWIAGFAFSLIGTLAAGACIACSNATESHKVLDFIERVRPTRTNGFAPIAERYAQDPSYVGRDFTSIRGGNLYALLPAALRPHDQGLRHNIYGMTETGGALTMSPDESDQPEHRRGSLGKLLPGYEVRIVDPESSKDVQPGRVGELWLRSTLMMVGYLGRQRHEIFEPDGWWRSGDLCRIDRDGFFYIAGRLGDMIKTSGANVAPKEVENIIQKLSGCPQCFVIGMPDAERGEVVAAVLVGACNLTDDELRDQLTGELSKYKIPRRIFHIREDDLPAVSSGKPDMAKLKIMVGRMA